MPDRDIALARAADYAAQWLDDVQRSLDGLRKAAVL